jgi:PAT family beta-lactamase induction signal transducer AmpG
VLQKHTLTHCLLNKVAGQSHAFPGTNPAGAAIPKANESNICSFTLPGSSAHLSSNDECKRAGRTFSHVRRRCVPRCRPIGAGIGLLRDIQSHHVGPEHSNRLDTHPKVSSRHIHPWVFMILIIPYGAASGYITVTLAYQLTRAGVAVAPVAALMALAILPHTWKFFWAPVIDITLSQKKWYMIGGSLSAIGIATMGFFPATKTGLAELSIVGFLTSLATTVLGMSVDSLMAHSTPQELKGRAGGWFQAGSLGGGGIGGGLGLVLVERLPSPWMASCIVGVLGLLCSVALVSVPTPARSFESTGLFQSLAATAKDLWRMMKSRPGALALVLCFLPIGSGAAPLAAIAKEWRASADTVAMVTGLLGGIISMAGCLIAGWICDRMDRKSAYVWFGIFQVAGGLAMALFPRNQPMYVLWASVYAFTTGFTYAAFSAFVLETIGKGAAATKYNALASLSNVPIYYVTNIDGWAHDRWGSTGMFYTESGLAVAGAVIFITLAKILLPNRKQSSPI